MKKLFIFVLLLCILPLVSASLYTNLNSYYQFQESAGPKNDSIGRFNITLTGGTLTSTNGLYGRSYSPDSVNVGRWGTVFAGMNNITISFWIYDNSTYNTEFFFGNTTSGSVQSIGGFHGNCAQSADGICLYTNISSGISTSFTTTTNVSRWQHVVYQIDIVNNNASLWLNGTYRNSSQVNFTQINEFFTLGGLSHTTGLLQNDTYLDELGVWNRTLSQLEITELYNNGIGRNFTYIFGQQNETSVQLISPADNSSSSSSDQTFHALISPGVGYIIKNSTLLLWHQNGTLFGSVVNSTVSAIPLDSYNSLSNIPINTFFWNFFACATNGTNTACNIAPQNFTFIRSAATVINGSFNTTAYETSYQFFSLNLSVDQSIIALTAFLVYNGTSYQATTGCNASGFCMINRSIDIPLITTNPGIHSFYWDLRPFDGTGTSQLNVSLSNQTISQIQLSNCGTIQNVSLNFTTYDEQNLTRINPYMFGGTFKAWLGTGSVIRNFSFFSPSTPEQVVCIAPREYEFKIDADIEYNNATLANYNTRNYYFRNASIFNNSQFIPLYLLKSVDSTSFILEVTDENLVQLNDTLIYIQRFYPGNNTYNTVQIALTDNNGKTVGFFETETVEYKFILVRYGRVIFQTEKRKVFPETSPFTLTFRVGTQAGSVFSPYQNLTNLFYSLTYNETTRIVEYTYIDTGGTTQLGRLLVQISNPSGLPTTICDVNSTQASATLLCNVTGYSGSIIARGYISRSPEQLVALLNSFIETATAIFGGSGMVMGILIILAVALITIYNPILQIIAVNVTVLCISILGLITFSPIFLFGFMAVSVLILILLRL